MLPANKASTVSTSVLDTPGIIAIFDIKISRPDITPHKAASTDFTRPLFIAMHGRRTITVENLDAALRHVFIMNSPAHKSANKISRRKIGFFNTQVLDNHIYVIASLIHAREKSRSPSFIVQRIVKIQSRNRVEFAIKYACEFHYGRPFQELMLFGFVQHAVLIDHILVYHDIVCKRPAGIMLSFNTVRTAHDGGKTIQFHGRLDDIAAISILRRNFFLNPLSIKHFVSCFSGSNLSHGFTAIFAIRIPSGKHITVA